MDGYIYARDWSCRVSACCEVLKNVLGCFVAGASLLRDVVLSGDGVHEWVEIGGRVADSGGGLGEGYEVVKGLEAW